jgi:plastocyanin
MNRFSAVVLPVVVLALAGCGSSSNRAADTISVVMKNINFNPTRIYAKVGQTVTWTNRDDAPHNVTYVSGPTFASSTTFANGESWTLKLTKPGIIRYLCTIHPGMDGSIVVRR